jgi:hypothetical protein
MHIAIADKFEMKIDATFTNTLISVEEVIDIMIENKWYSVVTDGMVAIKIENLTGFKIPLFQGEFTQRPGDTMILFSNNQFSLVDCYE